MKSALLVIDVQRGLCEGEQVSFESTEVIERINQAAAQARSVGAPVIFVQHETATGIFVHGSATFYASAEYQKVLGIGKRLADRTVFFLEGM